MNNGYNFNFIPNQTFMRSVPMNPGYTAPVPRISSLFGRGVASSLGSATTGASKITFSGILNGASKTLGVINQAIPVFYQVKPIWNNARTMFRVVKGLNSSDTNNNNNINNDSSISSSSSSNTKIKKEQTNAPTFFA